MPNLQSPRGTRDILPADQPLWQHIQEVGKKVAEQMGFQPISTPTYEDLNLFKRSIGEGTDVMDKELFLVRGVKSETEEYALRPEGTAGIVRAFIEHGMHTWPQPVKFYSVVNNFRYDRPQKGRYREHTQFDIEIFGDMSAYADAWVIYFTYRFLKELGLKNLKLKINTLGTKEERESYITSLRIFLKDNYANSLSEDSLHRLEKNPLRILDSKDPKDEAAIQDVLGRLTMAASFDGSETADRFDEVKRLLEIWKVPTEIDNRLVRGLDYYSHTAFEWVIEGAEGQQSSLGGGGRYDSLVSQLGGPATGAVGAGIGLDRVMEALRDQNIEIDVSLATPELFVVAADSQGKERALTMIAELLDGGWAVDAALNKEGMGGQMKSAAKSGALAALILGEQEVSANTVMVKILESGEQHTVPQAELPNFLRDHFLPETTGSSSAQ